jgi:hypothetical protein
MKHLFDIEAHPFPAVGDSHGSALFKVTLKGGNPERTVIPGVIHDSTVPFCIRMSQLQKSVGRADARPSIAGAGIFPSTSILMAIPIVPTLREVGTHGDRGRFLK